MTSTPSCERANINRWCRANDTIEAMIQIMIKRTSYRRFLRVHCVDRFWSEHTLSMCFENRMLQKHNERNMQPKARERVHVILLPVLCVITSLSSHSFLRTYITMLRREMFIFRAQDLQPSDCIL